MYKYARNFCQNPIHINPASTFYSYFLSKVIYYHGHFICVCMCVCVCVCVRVDGRVHVRVRVVPVCEHVLPLPLLIPNLVEFNFIVKGHGGHALLAAYLR